MGRSWISVLLVSGFLAAASVLAQQSSEIKLGAPISVGVRVVKAIWHPDGQTLMYARQGEKGTELGIFSEGQFEGKTIVSLAPGEAYEWTWLAGSKSALVAITKEIKKTKQVRVMLVEGETQSARQIYSETLPEADVDWIGINPSPLLKHAIVTINGEKSSKTFILCQGKSDLVSSPQIDEAQKKGILPCWSVDGTAVFSQVVTSRPITVDEVNSIVDKEGKAVSDQFKAKILLSGLTLTRTILTPPTGSDVIELMPTNAVFRPVRFRGPYIIPTKNLVPLNSKDQEIVIQFEQVTARENAVWLKRGAEKGTSATFLAVNSSRIWIAPKENAVAYLIDGALFVRPIL